MSEPFCAVCGIPSSRRLVSRITLATMMMAAIAAMVFVPWHQRWWKTQHSNTLSNTYGFDSDDEKSGPFERVAWGWVWRTPLLTSVLFNEHENLGNGQYYSTYTEITRSENRPMWEWVLIEGGIILTISCILSRNIKR